MYPSITRSVATRVLCSALDVALRSKTFEGTFTINSADKEIEFHIGKGESDAVRVGIKPASGAAFSAMSNVSIIAKHSINGEIDANYLFDEFLVPIAGYFDPDVSAETPATADVQMNPSSLEGVATAAPVSTPTDAATAQVQANFTHSANPNQHKAF